MSTQGIYLLFDFVHLLKNLRNLWITERSSQLVFEDNGKEHLADFNRIKDLYKWEKKDKVKMSELDEVSVYPKPIERQRLSTCLKVFSEKTIVALEDYGKVKSVDVSGTVLFLTKVHRWWTICNVRQKNVNLRKRQPLQAVVSDPMDERLNYLQEFGDMCFKMSVKQGKRNKQLSKDTAVSMHHTCYGLVDLAKHLLQEENYEYVCLGMFSTDPLEMAFTKLLFKFRKQSFKLRWIIAWLIHQ